MAAMIVEEQHILPRRHLAGQNFPAGDGKLGALEIALVGGRTVGSRAWFWLSVERGAQIALRETVALPSEWPATRRKVELATRLLDAGSDIGLSVAVRPPSGARRHGEGHRERARPGGPQQHGANDAIGPAVRQTRAFGQRPACYVPGNAMRRPESPIALARWVDPERAARPEKTGSARS